MALVRNIVTGKINSQKNLFFEKFLEDPLILTPILALTFLKSYVCNER
ncbi:MAG: hypothetical protein JETT_3228 [Candidatus Jettenia ecosi]|uniref:Uncharacterized protein n=1 Tax=Candidatus Jettenia ecosi TaxID=2494326 RepID=A0A533Q799_9BACT|nr:MAG: hypothetical protein JETT_3228 [Candidatus Jettenia ecosi]